MRAPSWLLWRASCAKSHQQTRLESGSNAVSRSCVHSHAPRACAAASCRIPPHRRRPNAGGSTLRLLERAAAWGSIDSDVVVDANSCEPREGPTTGAAVRLSGSGGGAGTRTKARRALRQQAQLPSPPPPGESRQLLHELRVDHFLACSLLPWWLELLAFYALYGSRIIGCTKPTESATESFSISSRLPSFLSDGNMHLRCIQFLWFSKHSLAE